MSTADPVDGRVERSKGRTRVLLRLVALVALIAGLAVIAYASGAAAVTTQEVREWVLGFSRLAPVVFLCLFAVLNTLGLPAPVLGAVGGALFGWFEGAAVTLSAMTVTASLQFWFARRLGGEQLRQQLGTQLGRIGRILVPNRCLVSHVTWDRSSSAVRDAS
jgi:uncharacterized membrane protein YdjX (TVP38/TMEM64 family)